MRRVARARGPIEYLAGAVKFGSHRASRLSSDSFGFFAGVGVDEVIEKASVIRR
jgi:hypothetical protein